MTIIFCVESESSESLRNLLRPTFGLAPVFHYLEVLTSCEIAPRN
jgi:hypothetical protein